MTHLQVVAWKALPYFPLPDVEAGAAESLAAQDVHEEAVAATEVNEGRLLPHSAAILLVGLPQESQVGGDTEVLVDELFGVRPFAPGLK